MLISRQRSILSILALLVATGCSSDTPHYTPEKDDQAMAAILSNFVDDQSGLTLSLCEDLETSLTYETEWGAGDCQIDHVVRADGQGKDHREDHSGIGCGGCPFSVAAFVTGHLSGGPIGDEPLVVSGEVHLQSGYDNNPYAFPYYFSLRCDDQAASCNVDAVLRKDGSLELNISLRGADGEHELLSQSASVCVGE